MKKKNILAMFMSVVLLAGCSLPGTNTDPRGSIEESEEEEEEENEASPTPTLVPSGKSGSEGNEEADPEPETPDNMLGNYDKTRPLTLVQTHEYNSYYDPDRQAETARATCNTVKLSDDDAESFPELAEALIEYNKTYEDYVYGAGFNSLKKMAIDMNSDETQTTTYYLYSRYELSLVRSDPSVTSIVTYSDEYGGGAHGVYYYKPVNFRSSDGEKLSVYDVLQSTDELPELLEKKLLEDYGHIFTEKDGLAETFETRIENGEEFDFSLGYDNITFYFQIYDLGPYAAGSQRVTLRFENYPDLVRRDFTQAADDYICQIPSGGMLLPGTDDVVYTNCGNKGNKLSFTVGLNEEEIFSETYESYLLEPYLVHCDGNNFIYLDSAGYECNTIYMYEFYDGALNQYDFATGFGLGNDIQGDTQNVKVYRMMFFVTGFVASRSCYVDGAGELAYDQEYYMVNDPDSYEPLVLKQNWETQDPDGNDVKLREGENLSPYRTDGETWIDMRRESGEPVRFYVQSDEDGQYIDGVDIEDIFDNILYIDW